MTARKETVGRSRSQGVRRPVVRRYAPDDESAVLHLLKASLGEAAATRKTSEAWAWKHLQNPFGPSYIWVACEADGEVIGVRALVPWWLRIAGERIRAVQAVDTATHPGYRRRGVFSTLTSHAVDVLRREEIALIFNTPNIFARPGYRKLGWQDVGGLAPLILVLRPARFAYRLARDSLGFPRRPAEEAPRGASVEVENLLADDADINELLRMSGSGCPGDATIGTFHTLDYLKWRYARHPHLRYHALSVRASTGLDGALIFRQSSRFGLSELLLSELFLSEQNAKVCWALLDELMASVRADYVLAYFPEGSVLREAVRRYGFRTIPDVALNLIFENRVLRFPQYQKPRRLMVNVLNSNLSADPLRLGAWNLSIGDLEVF